MNATTNVLAATVCAACGMRDGSTHRARSLWLGFGSHAYVPRVATPADLATAARREADADRERSRIMSSHYGVVAGSR